MDAKLALATDRLVSEIYDYFADLAAYEVYLDAVLAEIPPGHLDAVLIEILSAQPNG